MKIIKIEIKTPTEEDDERVFYYVKQFCIDNFRKFKVKIEGTNFNFEQDLPYFGEEEKEEKKEKKEFVYPPGHNWEGLTPEQVNKGYKKQKELKNEKTDNKV